jgi:hypothetical protein
MNKTNGNVNPLYIPDKINGDIFVDCEATGLNNPSYPISIALKSTCGFQSQVLIKKHQTWNGYHMDKKAIEIHHIQEQTLNDNGYNAEDVASWLLELSKKQKELTLYSDNPSYESMWINHILSVIPIVDTPNIFIGNTRNIIIQSGLSKNIDKDTFDKKFKEYRKKYPHTHDALDDLEIYVKIMQWIKSY